MKILCISDLHTRSKTREHIQEYANKLSSFIKREGFDEQIAYLVICGDIAYSGEQEQYNLAGQIISVLMASCHINDECVIMVPGNHDMADVKRMSKCMEGAYNESVQRLFDAILKNNMGNNEDETIVVDSKVRNVFKNYSDFRELYISDDCSYVPVIGNKQIKYVCGIKVFDKDKLVFVELNSSWERPAHNARFGGPIVDSVYIKIQSFRRKGYIVVTTFHHPFRCMEEKEYVSSSQYQVYDQILKMSDICLAGHVHGMDVKDPDLLGNICQFIQIGGFCSIDYDNAKYESSAAIIDIDMVGRRMGVQHLTYNSNEWKCDPSLTYYDLRHLSLNNECGNGNFKWGQNEISDEKHRMNIIYKYLNPCRLKKETDNCYTVHISKKLIFNVQFYDLEKDKDILDSDYPRLIIMYHCLNETKFIQLKENHKSDLFQKKLFFILEKD